MSHWETQTTRSFRLHINNRADAVDRITVRVDEFMETSSQLGNHQSIVGNIHASTLSFNLSASCSKFGPRLGQITLSQPTTVQDGDSPSSDASPITIDTPNILVSTSRGVVAHLSRDHCNSAMAIKWINVPFESL